MPPESGPFCSFSNKRRSNSAFLAIAAALTGGLICCSPAAQTQGDDAQGSTDNISPTALSGSARYDAQLDERLHKIRLRLKGMAAQGVGVTGYLNEVKQIEDLRSKGADQSLIETRLSAFESAVQEQMDRLKERHAPVSSQSAPRRKAEAESGVKSGFNVLPKTSKQAQLPGMSVTTVETRPVTIPGVGAANIPDMGAEIQRIYHEQMTQYFGEFVPAQGIMLDRRMLICRRIRQMQAAGQNVDSQRALYQNLESFVQDCQKERNAHPQAYVKGQAAWYKQNREILDRFEYAFKQVGLPPFNENSFDPETKRVYDFIKKSYR